MKPSNSELTRTKLGLFSCGLDAEASKFWSHVNFCSVYREYILQSYSIVRASVPLMEAAARACRSNEFRDDPVCVAFGAYLEHHIPEEIGHHEWILNDGNALGLSRQWISRAAPSETSMRLVGIQYYLLNHIHPISLAGYIAVMEGNPPSTELIEAVVSRSGLPMNAFSSFLLHGKIDPSHREDLNRVLDQLPLTEEHHTIIGLSMIRTIQNVKEVLANLNNGSPE